VTPRTRVLLVNTPHNPCGKVFTRDELAVIAEVCREHDLVAVSDEVYEHLTYDVEHVPLATLPGMAERTLTISSAGKSFSFTGWKIGWITGPPVLVDGVRTVKQFLTYVSGAPFQHAVAHALRMGDEVTDALAVSLKAKRDRIAAGLQAAGFEVSIPDGTYFICADIRPVGEVDGLDFCRRLPELAGVVAIPTQVFYDDQDAGRHLIRFAFCKRDEVIDEACERLAKLAVR
jgi:N-succinyldiaminopimelate aminotransferase